MVALGARLEMKPKVILPLRVLVKKSMASLGRQVADFCDFLSRPLEESRGKIVDAHQALQPEAGSHGIARSVAWSIKQWFFTILFGRSHRQIDDQRSEEENDSRVL